MAISTTAGAEDQYASVTGGAGLFDRSERGTIDLGGPDAVEYLQGQVTNDVESLAPCTGCYAALLNPKGRILGDVRVLLRGPELLWLDTEASALDVVLKELRTYKIGRNVELADRSGERALLSLLGARAREAARVASGSDVPVAEHGWTEASVAGNDLVIAGTSLGVDLMLDAGAKQAVTAALVEAGALIVDEPAAELARIEQGLPRYGIDFSDENLPGEAGIVERAVSFTKGCYVGQEPVARMFHRGHPNRLLRGLSLTAMSERGAALTLGEREVGRIGSIGDSPRLGPIALAIVRREASPGDQLTVGGSATRATVIELPFGER